MRRWSRPVKPNVTTALSISCVILLNLITTFVYLYHHQTKIEEHAIFATPQIINIHSSDKCFIQPLPDPTTYCPMDMPLKIVIITTVLPKPCGIATFSDDMKRYMMRSLKVAKLDTRIDMIALEDNLEGRQYKENVVYVIHMQDEDKYERAAQFIAQRKYDLVVLQHEFGIIGGKYGEYSVRIMEHLHYKYNIPVIVNMHTVVSDPPLYLIPIVERMGQLAQQIHVLSPSACTMLKNRYHVDSTKCKHFPHGVDDTVTSTKRAPRTKFIDKKVILTFGLMSQNKGLEYMIEAMKKIIQIHSSAIYVIVGQRHPTLAGAAFLETLQQLTKTHNVEKNIIFVNKFATDDEILDFMSNSDIYVTPYPHTEQISSGTVSRAVAMGLPVVSTKFTYAQDVLSDGRGVLVDIKNSDQLASAIIDLLDHPHKRRDIACAAKRYGQHFAWSHVVHRYYCAYQNVVTASRISRPRMMINE